jgi:hypothetical protein
LGGPAGRLYARAGARVDSVSSYLRTIASDGNAVTSC